jgi:cupin-like protein
MRFAFRSQKAVERRVRLSDDTFAREFRGLRQPVVLGDAISGRQGADGLEELRARFGDCELNRIYSRFDGKHVSRHLAKSFGAYLDSVASGRVYIQLRRTTGTQELEPLRPLFDWFSPLAYEAGALQCKTFWIGNGHPGFGLHRDVGTEQFLCQIVGRKGFILIPDDWRNTRAVYPYRFPSRDSFRSRVWDVFEPDLERFPDFVNAEAYVGTLEPGDALYIPSSWWHECWPIGISCSLGFRHRAAAPYRKSLQHVTYSLFSRRGRQEPYRKRFLGPPRLL